MPVRIETPCREWQGAKVGGGYGRVKHRGEWVYLHRWVMAQIHGWEALEGKVVRHRCDNPSCYRYDHLELGTKADNSRDMAERGRSTRGERNRHARLTAEDVIRIRSLHASGMRQKDIADEYEISYSHMSGIIHRRFWHHV